MNEIIEKECIKKENMIYEIRDKTNILEDTIVKDVLIKKIIKVTE